MLYALGCWQLYHDIKWYISLVNVLTILLTANSTFIVLCDGQQMFQFQRVMFLPSYLKWKPICLNVNGILVHFGITVPVYMFTRPHIFSLIFPMRDCDKWFRVSCYSCWAKLCELSWIFNSSNSLQPAQFSVTPKVCYYSLDLKKIMIHCWN